ncbi:F-box/FBD/LRR-repeat protein [Thalictrum thalictroides]|uniref:F-box/FBD/LRR-repeat protein n=1 Tax=Thalictrum thalictroides TaxID=46969 RepID=A0A7J6X3S0_THATH|nr:F-box/FBD/LRR-repeat protein [Thalictrum thalictroides]
MPIRDAVKTSTLSTSWRYKWMSMSTFIFNKTSIPPSFQRRQRNAELVNFVHNLLIHDDAISINMFSVRKFLYPCLECDQLIQLLSRKILKRLVLVFKDDSESYYQLPDCLFHCEYLKTLELKSCIMNVPSHEFLGFRHLTRLHLRHVTLTNQVFESLVAKIPLLNVLKVCWCKTLNGFIIHAPNLTCFQLKGTWKRIHFKHAPNLMRIDIKTWHDSFNKRWCRLDKMILGRLDKLEILVLYHPRMEFFSIDKAPKRLRNTYPSLASICMAFNIHNLKELLAVLLLFGSSPCLNKLNILFRVARNGLPVFPCEENFWEDKLRKRVVVFLHLKTIDVTRFSGVQHEVGFIQFILLNAIELVTFHIRWGGRTLSTITDHEKQHVVDSVLKSRRASPKVNIIFDYSGQDL